MNIPEDIKENMNHYSRFVAPMECRDAVKFALDFGYRLSLPELEEKDREIESLKRISSLYEQAAIERDRYKGLIEKAFEYSSPLSKKGKIYQLKLGMFEREHGLR